MNKKVSNSRNRIMELMEYYGINQTELCRRTGLQKSALSNYLNGDREPRQSQISLIADPFNINPAWLMGYDVPMEIPIIEPSDISKEMMEQAINLYNAYANATSEIQQAVNLLLKQVKPAVENLQNQVKPFAENLQKTTAQLPHLVQPQSKPEVPHLKKDKD